MTALIEDPATGDSTLQALLERKQRVAPEAASGNKKAKDEWNLVIQEIAQRELELQMVHDAKVEQLRREAEEEAQGLAAERQRKESELKAMRQERDAKLRALEKQIDALVPFVEEALSLGKRIYQLSMEVGQRTRWGMKQDIADAIKMRLSPSLSPEFDYVPVSYRRSLVAEDGPRGSHYKPGVKVHNDVPAITATKDLAVAMQRKPGETAAERKARRAQIDAIIEQDVRAIEARENAL